MTENKDRVACCLVSGPFWFLESLEYKKGRLFPFCVVREETTVQLTAAPFIHTHTPASQLLASYYPFCNEIWSRSWLGGTSNFCSLNPSPLIHTNNIINIIIHNEIMPLHAERQLFIYYYTEFGAKLGVTSSVPAVLSRKTKQGGGDSDIL